MDPYIGELRWVAFAETPQGWMPCDGQVLEIRKHQALFSLIGFAFGGDGQTTFALPKLEGRTLIGIDDHIPLGASGGEEKHTLTLDEMPPHAHPFFVTSSAAKSNKPSGMLASAPIYATGGWPNAPAEDCTTTAGDSQPHDNMQPYITLRCIINVDGMYPSRS